MTLLGLAPPCGDFYDGHNGLYHPQITCMDPRSHDEYDAYHHAVLHDAGMSYSWPVRGPVSGPIGLRHPATAVRR